MDINVETSKYKETILLAPLDARMELLSADKQLALCLMSLERLYTTYFVKYDKKGAKNFSKLLDILEQSLFAGEVPETDIVEQLADWCDQCVDKMDDGRISEWKQCAIEIMFPDYLCQFVESLVGICRQKNPFEFGDIYQIGVDLCEMYELDFLHTTEVDFMSLHDFLAMRHKDVADAVQKSREKALLYKQKKIPRQEYFEALDILDNLCSNYPEDAHLYGTLRKKPPEHPQDIILMHIEAERIKGDLLFLEQCGDFPNTELLNRLKAYRQLNILKFS